MKRELRSVIGQEINVIAQGRREGQKQLYWLNEYEGSFVI